MATKLLGEYLLAKHKVRAEQLKQALDQQQQLIRDGRSPLIGTILVAMGAISERELVYALQEQANDRKRMRA